MRLNENKTHVLIIFLLALTRVIPHWPNVTPLPAAALSGGAWFKSGLLSYGIPIVAMLLSDFVLGIVFGFGYTFHTTLPFVYASMMLCTVIGRYFTDAGVLKLTFGAGTISAIAFFFITNFGVWATTPMYPHTLSGLATCYLAGLMFYPDGGNFFLNLLASTWGFVAVAHVGSRLLSATVVKAQI